MLGIWVKKPKANDCVAVFVHGILSNGEECWRHRSGVAWPEVLASDQELSGLGVYVFTYRTGFFSGNYRVGDASDSLKEHLQLDGVLSARCIIFVCHSMGGLVVRKYLVDRAADLVERDIAVGLFLIASPSLGADYADWLAPIARLVGNSQADALRFVRNNDWLMDLDAAFMNLKESRRLRLEGKELIEEQYIFARRLWRKQVVEPFAGARYFGEAYKVPGSDHFSIAKIEGPQAIQHRLLKQFIQTADEDSKAGAQMFASRLQRLIMRAEDGSASALAAYLFYISRDRVASIFHQVDADALQRSMATTQFWLRFSEPGAVSEDDRSRRALVNQLGVVLAHLAEHAVIKDLGEAIDARRIEADWYIVSAAFQSEGWIANNVTQRLVARVGDLSLVLTCATANFAGVVNESGILMPTSTSAIFFAPDQAFQLRGLVRLVTFDPDTRTLQGTALFLAIQPLVLRL